MDVNQANIDYLTNILHEFGYLGSIQEARVLAILIIEPKFSTVKDICEVIGIPDSKIYPAIKNLESLNLIQRDPNTRPNRFYFSNPKALEDYLSSHLDEEIKNKKENMSKLQDILHKSWNPLELELGPVAYLSRGKEIFNEIMRIHKRAEHKIFYLFSPAFEQYIDLVVNEIPDLLSKGIKIELAYPKIKSFEEKLLPIIQQQSPLIKIKRYLLINSSYIVVDGKIMLSFTHQRIGDVAMLTDDQILVEAINNCWDLDNCCVFYEPSESIQANLDIISN